MKRFLRHTGTAPLAAGLALLLCTLAACTQESGEPAAEVPTDSRPVIMNIVIPRSQSAGTRAITAAEENAVRTVDVLAFRVDGTSETFLYSAIGTLAPDNAAGSATLRFVATLQQQEYEQRLVVITNARDQVSALLGGTTWVGADKVTMLSGLEYSLPAGQDRWNAASPGDYLALPMWGESAPETITASTKDLPAPIDLMRMVARIDVQLDNTVTGLTSQFRMKSVSLYNTNTGGRIVPAAAGLSGGTPSGYVSAPTIPAELQPYTARVLGPIEYTDFTAPGTTDVAMTGAIYTFETQAATVDAEATCLVVGGLYGTDTTPTYYRVEFYAPGTNTRLDILRNHRYLINITSVAGRGHATAADAFSSNAVNMTANILVWNQPGLDNVVFDGQNTLALSSTEAILNGNLYSAPSDAGENVIQVYTDVPAGWAILSINNPDDTPSSWLTSNTPTGPAGTPGDLVIQTSSPNTTDADRTGIITIAAGRLQMRITVTQTNRQPIDLQIVNSSGQQIDNLVFSGSAGVAPAARSFTVKWLPTASSVTVVANQTGQYEFPNHGSTPAYEDGAPYQGETLTTGGTHTYTVTPPSLTSAELAANPFVSKSTRFDFTVDNGFTTMTQSITLTQLNYALVVEPSPFAAPYFPMGGSYSYRVRSNAGWRISNIVEYPRTAGSSLIAAPTGTDNVYIDAAGAPNFAVGGGFVEQFRANPAARGNSGYADVVYSSTENPAAFAPVTRRLYFPAAPFTIYGIASMPSGNANNWNYYSGNNGTPTAPAATNDIQTMAITPANFGTTLDPALVAVSSIPVSRVFVPPILVRGYQNNNTGTVTVQHIMDAAATNPDMLVISGSSSFNRVVADSITNNFLKKDKTVFLCCEDVGTINAMFQSLVAAGYMTGNMYYNTQSGATYGAAPVYWFYNLDDPILNGPFMKNDGTPLRGNAYWGQDGNGSSPFWFSDISGIVSYSNAENQSNTTDPLPGGLPAGSTMGNGNTAWRFTRCPLVVVTDGGFLASYDQSATSSSPSRVDNTTKYPGYAGNYGSGGTRRDVYNAVFAANVTAWAIQRRTTR